MGTTQSYLSPEVLVTATVVAGAVGFGYSQIVSASGDSSSKEPPTSSVATGKKGKGKKKDPTASGISTPTTDAKPPGKVSVVSFPAVIPGQFDNDAPETSAGSGGEGASKTKKSKKKKAGKAPETQAVTAPVDEPITSPAVSVTFPESSTTSPTAKASTKSKKRKTQAPSQILANPSASSASGKSDSHSQQLQKSTASLASFATESDGEWTRVSRRADKIHTSSTTEGLSDVGQTTTSATTGTSSPIDTRTEEGEEDEEEDVVSGPGERHPLAKKLLPKPRKTGVEDMLGTSDYPSYSRVMRVQPGEQPAAGFSWGDYEDVAGDNQDGELDGDGGADADGEDDGWGVVKRGGRPKNKISSSSQSISISRIASASETMTKRQRQNAARREVEKSAKQEAEQVRLATLAKHKREQERIRMEAQYAK